MKIALAQIKSITGSIDANIAKHHDMIRLALRHGAQAIFFPELSLTGYEPKLAYELATSQEDSRFDSFQHVSDIDGIVVCVGAPIKSSGTPLIGMVIFQPKQSRRTYSKQILHDDELPFFTHGGESLDIHFSSTKIAPAICYESLLSQHSDDAVRRGATIYVASVAKSERGIAKASLHFPKVAKTHSIPILVVNCIGPSDDFVGAGKTSAWNSSGILLEQLDEHCEGMLIFDTESSESFVVAPAYP